MNRAKSEEKAASPGPQNENFEFHTPTSISPAKDEISENDPPPRESRKSPPKEIVREKPKSVEKEIQPEKTDSKPTVTTPPATRWECANGDSFEIKTTVS